MRIFQPEFERLKREAERDFAAFWGRIAREEAFWFKPFERAYDGAPPSFRWFVGGETNVSYAALDVHLERGWGGHAALIGLNERGERRVLTYNDLHRLVRRIARGLRALGVEKGDRVAIYMPTMPEAIAAMLATTRIGAIHVVVFAGFGAGALRDRIALSGAKVLLYADRTFRRGKTVDLEAIVVEALREPLPELKRAVVLRREAAEGPRSYGAFPAEAVLDWEAFLQAGEGESDAATPVEANEPAFILATSGTTAKPKLVVHAHGPYQVGVRAMAKWMYALRPTDIWWSTSDIGWIVGHSYIVYGPLFVGATTIAFEGALDHPGPETFYRLLESERVTGLFVAPTLIRMLMKYGADVARRFDRTSVERVFSAGETLNPPAWAWFQDEVFEGRVPVIDHWWQTETAAPVIGNPYGLGLLPIKPGSAGVPLPGMAVRIVDDTGTPLPAGRQGMVVVERPFPTLTARLWGEPERYAESYWRRIPGVYYAGDAAHVDEDGYVWFAGRADEVLNVAGHRLGTVEVESALLRHPAVAEAGVIGRPDPLRGEVIAAFVVLKGDVRPSPALEDELRKTVRQALGPVAVVGDLIFVPMLPKTRSGKIMRRVLKATLLGQPPGDISTIEEEASVAEIMEAWRKLAAARSGADAGAPPAAGAASPPFAQD
ncbi:MAG: Acetyl-coenzyme A synthetase [Hydrogenibacillus schlegelii]|uniref:Acetyl-coenzyme A synthetase n=1 Tax=Hydrogenibacillus schlegelii TaxID=1484 RepID=A0A2T5GBU4_HYDSH|nr:acetate--CoA ligase [Hydrogenibacillus schlegelii]PTQ53664.1 MAG: Acetyl-coenzyme A synthetase [Hydrogenibacillus schlegelii]